MAGRFYFLIALLIFLLQSCAQIGVLTGGEQDFFAPKPVKISPEPSGTQFKERKIRIQFDEYVKLVTPAENLVVQPADLKVKATLKRKTLVLDFENEPRPNTTYVISMNGLVQDLSEQNDSLMQYVFSTGDYLDSISYSGSLKRFEIDQAVKGFTVGLYLPEDSLQAKPRYFVRSNAEGDFQFTNLAAGNYRFLAFDDANRNLSWQPSESNAFSPGVINLNQSLSDSVAWPVSPGVQAKVIRNKKAVYPALLQLGANTFLDDTRLKNGDGTALESSHVFRIAPDSLVVLIPEANNEMLLIYTDENQTDTLRTGISKGKLSSFHWPNDKEISSTKKGIILFSDAITSIDTALISCQNSSGKIIQPKYEVFANQLHLVFEDSSSQNAKLRLAERAVQTIHGMYNDSIQIDWTIKAEKSFGSMRIPLQYFPETVLLELCNEKLQVLRRISYQELQQEQWIKWITPGNYRFRLVYDHNGNGFWDGGQPLKGILPEAIEIYPKLITVRANWENEIQFDFKP